jgi:peptidylprolyl isomerase
MMKSPVFLVVFILLSFVSKGQDTSKTSSGLRYVILEAGDGETPSNGDEVKVRYIGYLSDGSIFEAPSSAFRYTLGDKGIIPGWNEGIALMKEGAKYVFILPPSLGYGEKGSKDFFNPEEYAVPPNETIIFDIELLKVKQK